MNAVLSHFEAQSFRLPLPLFGHAWHIHRTSLPILAGWLILTLPQTGAQAGLTLLFLLLAVALHVHLAERMARHEGARVDGVIFLPFGPVFTGSCQRLRPGRRPLVWVAPLLGMLLLGLALSLFPHPWVRGLANTLLLYSFWQGLPCFPLAGGWVVADWCQDAGWSATASVQRTLLFGRASVSVLVSMALPQASVGTLYLAVVLWIFLHQTLLPGIDLRGIWTVTRQWFQELWHEFTDCFSGKAGVCLTLSLGRPATPPTPFHPLAPLNPPPPPAAFPWEWLLLLLALLAAAGVVSLCYRRQPTPIPELEGGGLWPLARRWLREQRQALTKGLGSKAALEVPFPLKPSPSPEPSFHPLPQPSPPHSTATFPWGWSSAGTGLLALFRRAFPRCEYRREEPRKTVPSLPPAAKCPGSPSFHWLGGWRKRCPRTLKLPAPSLAKPPRPRWKAQPVRRVLPAHEPVLTAPQPEPGQVLARLLRVAKGWRRLMSKPSQPAARPWNLGWSTHPGPVRTKNDDFVLAFEMAGCQAIVVADGVSGEPWGGAAAYLACQAAAWSLMAQLRLPWWWQCLEAEEVARAALLAASRRLIRIARLQRRAIGFRTTLIVVLVTPEAYGFAHIGDGHASVLRADGTSEVMLVPQHPEGSGGHLLAACLGPERLGQPVWGSLPRQPGDLLLAGTDGVFSEDVELGADFGLRLRQAALSHEGDLQQTVEMVLRELCVARDDYGFLFEDNLTLVLAGDGRMPVPVSSQPQPQPAAQA